MGLRMPSLGGLLCLGVGFALFAGLAVVVIWAVTRRPSGPPAGFPVQSIGPGRYRISGVDKNTRADTTWFCEADNPDNAKIKAELEGIIVTRVERA
jgi:hypothetical protein